MRTFLTLFTTLMLAAPATAQEVREPALEPALSTPLVFAGFTASADGRFFSPFRPQTPGRGFQLGEWIDGVPQAYPTIAINRWRRGLNPKDHFVGVNAVRVGPEGDLWVVDTGAEGIGQTPKIGGPKLVQIDLETDRVVRRYPLGSVTWPVSYVDDVRFRGRTAYLTDAGAPGLIVLDLASGDARRVLEGHPSAAQRRTLTAENKPVQNADNLPVILHADQLELSPGGRWLYFQSVTGPLYRVETRWLDDPNVSDAERARHVERFADTGNTGGTAIDADGNIYASDLDTFSIVRITPGGEVSTLIQDPRLVWVDAMWVGDDGALWLPASQLNRTPALNRERSDLELPTVIYRLELGLEPFRN